ncbi:MAG: asparaginase [Aldersonia sp.]|nr:asparaginase [Aldersonia sp.]
MPHVVVLTTGGTISSRRTGDSVIAVDDASQVLAGIDFGDDVIVEAQDVLRVGSYRMTFADLRTVAEAVSKQLARPDVDGVVVTHGTDTLEETAVLLDLVHAEPGAVVLTGAQRSADVADTDGPRNLRDAVAVAAHPAARHHGAVIVFDGSVYAARGVRKSHTLDLAAFSSPAGTVGVVHSGTVRMHSLPIRPQALPAPRAEFDAARVDIVLSYLGGDDTLLHAAVAAGARGIVLAGTGLGNAPAGVAETVAKLVSDGVVVALSTRVAAGPVLPVYGHGGGADLVAAGAVPVTLPAAQARIALALLLSSGRSPADVTAALGRYA